MAHSRCSNCGGINTYLNLGVRPWPRCFLNMVGSVYRILFILSTISLCATGLKALFGPSHCMSTAQLSSY